MPGKKCPKCGELTFFKNARGGECSNCGYEIVTPAKPNGSGGRGYKCPICGKMTMFNGKCRNCGAEETI